MTEYLKLKEDKYKIINKNYAEFKTGKELIMIEVDFNGQLIRIGREELKLYEIVKG